jgi:sigma-E factor negative regulatory protein RseA
MTVTKNERLSALVDDEADGFECRRLLDQLGRNPDDLSRWERYHLIGDALRGGLRRRAKSDFAAGIMARIADEPVPVPATRTVGQRLVRPTAGLAMAASVAVAVLVGVVNVTGTPDADGPVVAEAGPAGAPTATRGVVQLSDATVATAAPVAPPALEPMEASDARLHSYIVNHAEHAAGRGLMPYVRVVGYESPAQ